MERRRHGGSVRALAGIVALLVGVTCGPSGRSELDGNANDVAAAVRAICQVANPGAGSGQSEHSLAQFIASTPDATTIGVPLAWCVARAISKDGAATGAVHSVASHGPEARTEWVVSAILPRSAQVDPDRVLDEIGAAASALARDGFDLAEVRDPNLSEVAHAKSVERERRSFFMRSILVAPDVGSMECSALHSRVALLADGIWICFWVGLDPERSEVWRSLRSFRS